LFLKQFAKYPENFIHLDIAASAFAPDGKANGVPIRSLINFIRRLQ
jgi:leucyl aminopeptidase